MLYEYSGVKAMIEHSLSAYIEGIDLASYHPRLVIDQASILKQENSEIESIYVLSNHYYVGKSHIFVENLSSDLGAGVRTLCALKSLRRDLSFRVNLILLVVRRRSLFSTDVTSAT